MSEFAEMLCNKTVTTDGWHFHKCNKPAKWVWFSAGGSDWDTTSGKAIRCGIHAKRRPASAEPVIDKHGAKP